MRISFPCFLFLILTAFLPNTISAQESREQKAQKPPTQAEIQTTIDNLGSPVFAVREKAQAQLLKVGAVAKPLLLKALTSKNAEIRLRANAVLTVLRQAELQKLEVHVVGLYEGNKDNKAEVHVRKSAGPIILVLCAYDSVQWNIKADPGADIERIILSGYHKQTVVGIKTKVTSQSYDERSPSYFFTYDHDEKRFPAMVAEVRAQCGRGLTSFQGRYRFQRVPFVVPFKIGEQ